MDIDLKIKELELQVNALKLESQLLSDRIKVLEEGDRGTGVYFDGTPDYVKNYVNAVAVDDKKEEVK